MEGEKSFALYYSKRCSNSQRFMEELARVPDVSDRVLLRCIDDEMFPAALREVPAVLDGALRQGKDAFRWLASKKREAVSPYAYGSVGPSPTTVFSFVDEDIPLGHTQDAFGAFGDENSKHTTTPQAGSEPSVLDTLIAKRRNEVPLPLQRQ